MIMVTGAQTRIFQDWGGFLEEGYFNKHFIFDKQKKDRVGKNFLNVLKLLLFLEEFQPQSSYKIVLIKKILTWTNSFDVQKTASGRCCTTTNRSTFLRGFVRS